MIKEIPKSNRSLRPFKVHKDWEFTESSSGSISVYNIQDGVGGSFDPETAYTTNGLFTYPLYKSIEHQFYTNQDVAGVDKLGDRKNRLSTVERVLGVSGSVINIPPDIYGEEIKRESIYLYDPVNQLSLIDDGYSNLIYENEINDETPTSKGNVFYDHGLIVLSNLDGQTDFDVFTLEFQSTVTIYEHEYFLEVGEGEFNISQNPTAIAFNDGVPFVKKHFTGSISGSVTGSFSDYDRKAITDPTGSYLAPYITTIALYDDNLNMLATAKLAKPIKNLPDYPVNFIVRFDT